MAQEQKVISATALKAVQEGGTPPSTKPKGGNGRGATISVKQYAELTGMHPMYVRKLCREGGLPAHKDDNGAWAIPESAVREKKSALKQKFTVTRAQIEAGLKDKDSKAAAAWATIAKTVGFTS
jgi:excisionase family DNA binding protein